MIHHHKKRKSYGFTLSEIIITIAIIGTIAAMTIPTLSAKIQKVELENSFKVTYAKLNEILKMIEAENGSISNVTNNAYELLMLFKSYSAGSSYCSQGQAAKICWPARWITLNGIDLSHSTENVDTIILGNGASINLNCYSKTCSSNVELKEPIGCARLRVDTNGPKLPNKVGYDIFDFYITTDGLIPRGDIRTITSENNPQGWGKAAYLLRTMKIDY